ncbi:rhodanese-like domain-containing protein [Pseudodesulfovibrio piezophilus]|uniref:Rhodanese domain protein n=1 Tax=Pseudodesulfovibrio piezophilus (strain DSM 21447 / JCM 15486 / C1TLV30) TaxID=1322246 RepID=M1WKI7_PSEP2|nr:rhodanese-like domain-containing protein [Pseudodesulfovibrio piezophilus]CCH49671.1 Rhodanese domain protein [Pseudodesulfovibrio piezophilus C1TLV30]
MKKLCLTILACAVLLGGCLGAEDKFAREVTKEAEAVKLAKETVRGGYELITVTELKALMDKNTDMTIIDTMPYEASYQKGHIPGALQFLFPIKPMETWDTNETAGKSQEDFLRMLGPDKDKLLVIYCGFVKCGRSDNGAAWAKKLGYTNVQRLPGGIFAWRGAEYPVESGS